MARLFLLLVFCFPPLAAHAHFGHVGELAGHGHELAVGAAIAAAALIAALAARGKRKHKDDEEAVPEAEGEAG